MDEKIKDLGLEIVEISETTMLDEMGASLGWNSCSVVDQKTTV